MGRRIGEAGFLSFRVLKGKLYSSSRPGAEGMWISPRMIFIFRCTLLAISKVCGKGGKTRSIVFPGFPQTAISSALLPSYRSYVLSRNRSNSFAFASCIRRAASVSLMAAATLFSALMLSPSRRYCAGFSNNDRVSSGVW
jgi:hypothetical protein